MRIWTATALLASAVGFAASPALAACKPTSEGGAMLEMTIEGLHSSKGQVTVTVYPDDPDKFLASGAKEARIRVPAVAPSTIACLELEKPGTYAIAVYHDENMDKKFNRTLVGLPAEGYGFSRNPAGLLGLPAFKDVKFAAVAGVNPLSINLSY
jgi:uncharacterized protein (DUF2141 family)